MEYFQGALLMPPLCWKLFSCCVSISVGWPVQYCQRGAVESCEVNTAAVSSRALSPMALFGTQHIAASSSSYMPYASSSVMVPEPWWWGSYVPFRAHGLLVSAHWPIGHLHRLLSILKRHLSWPRLRAAQVSVQLMIWWIFPENSTWVYITNVYWALLTW